MVPADVLMELLGGDDPPRTAVKALQTHISALRHALGDGFVVTEGIGWRLNTAETDASRYKSLTKSGRDAFNSGDTSGAVARFDAAVTLWRGIPELPDGRPGASEKTRWIEGHAALIEDRADALLATGRAAELIGDLEAAVADAPLRERRWGQLMLALYRAGEAAAHAHTWSVVAGAQAAFERHEIPATTPNMPYIDHRPVLSVEAVDLATFVGAVWDVIPEPSVYIEAVHRLSELGAVVTQKLKDTSSDGFEGEWRLIDLSTIEGDLINRCEVFDEADLDAALARFDELGRPSPAT